MAEALAGYLIGLAGSWLPAWFLSALAYLAVAGLHAFLIINVIAVGALVFIWAERKVSGRIQDRLGPTRCGGKFGWLQSLADGIKLITKEDLIPADADAFLFRIAPYVSFCASFAAYMALPFSDGWVAIHLDVGVFFILAVLGLEVFGVILAGYASASKWSLFGAMREAAQVVSYEVPLGLCVVCPVMVVGSMDLVEIGYVQRHGLTDWLIFHDPFMMFVIFPVYFTCALASVNRAPFDLAEAESELVAGFHTEYSGIRWSYFFMAEYGSMIAVSGLATILFFGGWNGPLPIAAMLGLTETNGPVAAYVGNLLGLLNFLFKCSLGVVFMIWVRWTLPRLRIDQVMKTCLKYCTPLAAFGFLGVMFFAYQFPGGILRSEPYGHHLAALEARTAAPTAADAPAEEPVEPAAEPPAEEAHAAHASRPEIQIAGGR